MVGLGILLGFYNEEQALSAIDFNTLGLAAGHDDPGGAAGADRLFPVPGGVGGRVLAWQTGACC